MEAASLLRLKVQVNDLARNDAAHCFIVPFKLSGKFSLEALLVSLESVLKKPGLRVKAGNHSGHHFHQLANGVLGQVCNLLTTDDVQGFLASKPCELPSNRCQPH